MAYTCLICKRNEADISACIRSKDNKMVRLDFCFDCLHVEEGQQILILVCDSCGSAFHYEKEQFIRLLEKEKRYEEAENYREVEEECIIQGIDKCKNCEDCKIFGQA